MRGPAAAVLLTVATVVSCTSDPPVPMAAETCDDLVPVGVSFVERMVTELQGQPLEVVVGDAPLPESIAELRTLGRDLDERASRLACDVQDLNAKINAAVSDLASDDLVVELFLDIVRGGVVGELPPPVATVAPVTEE